VDRKVLVSKLEETIVMKSGNTDKFIGIPLSSNQYPGSLYPQGYNQLERFEQELFPVFYFKAGEVEIKKTIACVHGENTTLILYEVTRAPKEFEMELLPLYSARDFHTLSHCNDDINKQYVFNDNSLRIKNYIDQPEVFITVPGSSFTEEQNWYHNFEYSVEQGRGMDYVEDLYTHGKFIVKLKRGSKLGVILSTEDVSKRDGFQLFNKERKRRESLLKQRDDQLDRLLLAGDKFIVKRGDGLKTIIAGYPWFSDWGRDTMISLPGLCLATGRFDDAKKILKTFSKYVSEGMLPNRFPDQGEIPAYNTIDASLWFFQAIYHYYKTTNDQRFVKSMLPVLEEIIQWHTKGTRFNIHVDENGLLYGGQDGVQLTWMDAKVGDWVVTPRRGLAVEVNALWYNALCIMDFLLRETNKASKAEQYQLGAQKVADVFNDVFWNEEKGYLYDYIDGEYKNDDIRPNQIYAVSLPFPLLNTERSEKVFRVVESMLLTPRGLRSLSSDHKEYRHAYGGGIWSRDGAYHQGTVWSFLIGPFIDALIRVEGEFGMRDAQGLLNVFLTGLEDGCVGNISEIFDGEPPHTSRGCVAQAWGVAEALRVGVTYNLFEDKKKINRKEVVIAMNN
jgi:predicted glycogen debranching enzyme